MDRTLLSYEKTIQALLLFSCSLMSDSLQPHELQHARLPCPSPCLSLLKFMSIESVMLSNFCCLFSSCPQSFPASGSFPMSQLFASGDQFIGALASASVLPMNIQDWFPLGWTAGSTCCPRDSQESSPELLFKSIISSALSLLYGPTLTYTTGKTIALTIWTFVSKVMSLYFNMLSRLVIAFLPRSKHLLISRLHHHLQCSICIPLISDFT